MTLRDIVTRTLRELRPSIDTFLLPSSSHKKISLFAITMYCTVTNYYESYDHCIITGFTLSHIFNSISYAEVHFQNCSVFVPFASYRTANVRLLKYCTVYRIIQKTPIDKKNKLLPNVFERKNQYAGLGHIFTRATFGDFICILHFSPISQSL